MKFNRSFPLIARRGASRALLLSAGLLLSGMSAASANNNGVKYSAPARPAARLITSAPQPSIRTTRARFVATGQPVSPVALRTANVAAAAFAATSDEQRVVDLINAERRRSGARPLVLDGQLLRVARLHSENMLRQNFFAHVGRDGKDAMGRVEAAGIVDWRSLAENIAYNYEQADPYSRVVGTWMQSEKHRRNILNPTFTQTGLGIAHGADGRIYFTQVFMTR